MDDKWVNVAKENGIKYSTYWYRINKSKWTPKKAATTPLRKERSDKKWIKIAKNNGISRDLYRSRVDRYGWSPSHAASTPKSFKKERPDQEWIDKAITNGISRRNYLERIRRYGYTPEEAATTPKGNIIRKDRKWIEVAKRNGIERETYITRVDRHGWSQEKAATAPVKKTREDLKWINVARKKGLSRTAFVYRVDENFMSPKEAATSRPLSRKEAMLKANNFRLELQGIQQERTFRDKENLYTITPKHYEIARANGIKHNTVKARVYNCGWTVQEAITKPVQQRSFNRPKGYSKFLEIAKENGVTGDLFYTRIKRGWTLENASSKYPVYRDRYSRPDKEWIEKASANGIGYSTYISRVDKLGWTYEEASTISVLPKGNFLNEESKERARKGFEKFKNIKG